MTTPIEYTFARQHIEALHDDASRRRLARGATAAGPAGRPDLVRRLVADARQRVAAILHQAGSPSHA